MEQELTQADFKVAQAMIACRSSDQDIIRRLAYRGVKRELAVTLINHLRKGKDVVVEGINLSEANRAAWNEGSESQTQWYSAFTAALQDETPADREISSALTGKNYPIRVCF